MFFKISKIIFQVKLVKFETETSITLFCFKVHFVSTIHATRQFNNSKKQFQKQNSYCSLLR